MNAFLKLARVFSRSTAPAGPFIGLREQRFLSDREFHRACKIIDWIQSVMETRTPYIDRHRLKSDIHDPQAIWKFWEGRPMYGAFRLVCSKDRHVINYLRMWTQHFTGYRLFTMERSEGKGFPDPGEIGPASDTRYALIAERPDDYVFKYRTLCQRLPRELHISPPSRFGEVGWNEGGRIVNHDTYAYQERIALLHASGGIDHLQGILATGRAPRVLEIGGGYGALAYHLKKIVPRTRVVIVDLTESLLFSALYLSLLFPREHHVYVTDATPATELDADQPGCTFIPNFMFDRLVAASTGFDLAINTLSMSEMSQAQVSYYCSGIRTMIGNAGAFFEQNQDNSGIGQIDARRIIAENFPCRAVVKAENLPHPLFGNAHVWSNRPWQPAASSDSFPPARCA